MWTKAALWGGIITLVLGGAVSAQVPLSAIDWLSDSLAQPVPHPEHGTDDDIPTTALPENVTVSEIDGPLPDAVGLLPSNITGLSRNLWGNSQSRDIAGRFQINRTDMYPAMLDLLLTLLLAELDPPQDSGPEGTLFLARLDTLLSLGALEQANALLDLSGTGQAELFRRAFDISLLLGTEDSSCATLRSSPDLSPTFPARIFCLARGGDWDAAALSLETGRALGYLTDFEDALLARFLDPHVADDQPRLFVPSHPSPLVFRLLEAIGEPLATSTLPRAYAQADLHANTGWKARLEAAERLVRTNSIGANRLAGLYLDGKAAASGGVWDRVLVVQALDRALLAADQAAISKTLEPAWTAMANAELEVPFAAMFSHRLLETPIPDSRQDLAMRIGFLGDDYEEFAQKIDAESDRLALLRAIAIGQVGDMKPSTAMEQAVIDGFHRARIPVRLQSLVQGRRLGEAILRAIDLFENGAHGDLDELTDALSFFRAIGLEDTARRAALQLLLLERRG